MINLSEVLNASQKDIDDVNEWMESEYSKYFAEYFKGEQELYAKVKSPEHIITDSELEWILTTLPLELFSVSEQLSRLKTAQEVIRINIKEKESRLVDAGDPTISLSKRKEDAANSTCLDRLLVSIYSTLSERVDRQMSFSRELIMSAKKVWDARRANDAPIPEVDTSADVPDYIPKKQYIK